MIDNLSLAISHGLMLLAAWRLIFRRDLDHDPGDEPTTALKRRRDEATRDA